MCGPPPPIRSGGAGEPVPPARLSGSDGAPPQLSLRRAGGPPQLRLGGAQAPSSGTQGCNFQEVLQLTAKISIAATRGVKELFLSSARESTALRSLAPTQLRDLTPAALQGLVDEKTTPEAVQAVAQRVLALHSSSSSLETLRDSPDSDGSSSPDNINKRTFSAERITDPHGSSSPVNKRSSSTERITDPHGRNFDITVETETGQDIIRTSRDGEQIYGPPVTTSQVTIKQVREIQRNTNPEMNSLAMEKFITGNIGAAHMQEAKDLFCSVIDELAKSPSAQPVSIDLECGRKQFRLIFDKSKNEVLLFNKEKFTEGAEKTVHDAIALPLSIPGGAVRRIEVESRAVLYSKPDMKSLLERGIGYAQRLQTIAGEDPRKAYIIPPPKSEYLTIDGMLMISTEKLSGDLMDEAKSADRSTEAFQTYLLEGLSGLSLIHEKGFVHCDAKIENLFLKGDTCQVGDLSTCRKQDADLPPYARDEDRENSRSTDKRSYDILSLGKSLARSIQALKAKVQTAESAAFIDRLEALIPDMTKKNPAERPSIDEVIARLRG